MRRSVALEGEVVFGARLFVVLLEEAPCARGVWRRTSGRVPMPVGKGKREGLEEVVVAERVAGSREGRVPVGEGREVFAGSMASRRPRRAIRLMIVEVVLRGTDLLLGLEAHLRCVLMMSRSWLMSSGGYTWSMMTSLVLLVVMT